MANDYWLSDVTRTHYDVPAEALAQEGFAQQHLRSRVSWVEVIDKDATDTIATYYNYDIHGNVKSLLQQIPGLEPKRTDYAYDLVSGKVNYVMYQFARPDQFIHRYEYDADNRITDVYTSVDGFIWDRDASYNYYLHGPLARVELGEHRVQGTDYYYTLQGWIKGVNMPYEGEPGEDGINSLSGKDVFAYALGYYDNDYNPINNSVTLSDNRDQLWTRLNEMNDHSGLYNGNISWMTTDLAKTGEIVNDRTKGMQALLYQYDQLHRIIKARSLTAYGEGTGFAARDTTAAPYDVDYTYDPNGNLFTLQRNDDQSGLLHDFDYIYYPNTNKLRQVTPPADRVYTGGAIVSNTELYRKITIQGNAYVPQGQVVELRALEEIEMDPDFESPEGTDFWAYIVADSGMYQYDKIGNLILDQHEGVKIGWTPYGKVREVKARNDSLITTFRYDGMGNRIEKIVKKKDSVDIISITHYVRDASGNVMGVYKDSVMAEQYVYGSSRLGMYRGGRYNGQRSLGEKQYELSNHLGNVLTTITDNIGMDTADSVWSTVLSIKDYYPFGLEMEGRAWSDTTATYRYGFNGKEKDTNGEWGNVAYDYGFRIYDPVIARFKSVDPITKSYPMLTPYQFASNRPIDGIDLDGLEYYTYHVFIHDGKPHIFKVDDHTTMSEAAASTLHGVDNFYSKYSKSFGEKGRGVEFKYYEYYTGKQTGERRLGITSVFFDKESKIDLRKHGIYYGPGSPTTYGPRFEEEGQPTSTNPYNFNIPPVDEVDALARQHDIDYDYPGYKPGGFLNDPKTVPMDIDFVRGLQEYLERAQQDGYVDKYTGKAPSVEAIEAAMNAVSAFTEIALKKEIQRLYEGGKKEIGKKLEKIFPTPTIKKANND